MAVSHRGAPMVGADAANGAPVSSTTSSARTMRRPSVARIEEAAAASTTGQFVMQRSGADLGQPPLPFGPHPRIGGRECPLVQQRLHIHHRSADDDRHRTRGRDPLDVLGGVLLIARDGRRLGDVQHVELVMGHTATLGDRQLRGPDVHSAVELHGVGIDDFDVGFTAQSLGHRQRQRRLSGPGRADDRERPHCAIPGSLRSCPPDSQTPAKYPTP